MREMPSPPTPAATTDPLRHIQALNKLTEACSSIGVEWIAMPGMSRSASNGSKVTGSGDKQAIVWSVDVRRVGAVEARTTLHGVKGSDTLGALISRLDAGLAHKERAALAALAALAAAAAAAAADGKGPRVFMPTCAPTPPKYKEFDGGDGLEACLSRVKRVREYPEVFVVDADDEERLAEYLK